ncbi:MAG: hypothetical protein GY745_00120 [Actinomycetia bacterium]|nr:hypothetical protein [Actinomycetes bacterium]MCP3911211.1 hypothetical protein [Actinomycetes bacterium]MCP4083452.1 hypothetical protein [Actinomycetes bacterium]
MNSHPDTTSPALLRLAAALTVAGMVFLILAGVGSLSLVFSALGALLGLGATIAVLSLLPARTRLLVDDDPQATRS